MDLSKLTAENEWVDIFHPEFGEVGVRFNVCAPFSRLHNSKTSRIAPQVMGEDSEVEDKSRAWEILQAESIVIDWDGIEESGKKIDFTPEKCSEVLRDERYHWMVSQVLEHLNKKKGYLLTIQRRFSHLLK